MGSLILTHQLKGIVPALKDFDPQDRPNATIVFWTFRVMVGLGFLMLGLGLVSLLLRLKKKVNVSPFFLRWCVLMGPSGVIAILAGWYTTEIGRQPWVVYGVMRTKDAVSNHSEFTLTLSLLIFIVLYFGIFGIGINYMLKLVAKGPKIEGEDEESDHDNTHRPARPLSAAPDHIDPTTL